MKWTRRFRATFTTVLTSVLLVSAILPSQVFGQSSSPATTRLTTDQSTVIVKLKPSANTSLSSGGFVSSDAAADSQLNSVLDASKVISKRSLISANTATIRAQQVKTNSSTTSVGDLADYYTLQLGPSEKADAVASKLKALGVVETAYAKPLPTPPPATVDYSGLQTYLKASPTGLGVNATIGGKATTKLYPGTNGSRTNFADLEYSWNTQHEDLSRLRTSTTLWANGTPVDPFSDDNHGTAVAGIVAADHNSIGVDGIVPSVSYHTINTNNSERGWDIANAIYVAANKMSAGDVMLIEQQALAPDGVGYAPIEVYPDVYDAIVYATSKGLNVIEPAGNGNPNTGQGYNLSDPQFSGMFTTARPNSGAIIVGAGGAGCSKTPAQARLSFSNYGSRVDMQAAGECVVTTGYGDLRSTSRNSLYTSGFNGTSSASAIIAAVATELSSSYEYSNAAVLTPAQLKTDLQRHGVAQNASQNSGNIGVLPNMAYGLQSTDITSPTAPVSLTGKANTTGKVALSWKAASDNLGYIKYYVYRNDVRIATAATNSYLDTTVKSKTKYSYKVVTVDGSDNVSAASNSLAITSH